MLYYLLKVDEILQPRAVYLKINVQRWFLHPALFMLVSYPFGT